MRILKSALVTLVLVGVATPASAQYRKILGAKLGVSVASLRGLDNTLDSENQTGFAAGVFYTIGQDVFSFQPEINITRKDYSFSDGLEDLSLDAVYVEPAVMLKAGLPLGAIRPSAQAGLGYGISASCEDSDGVDCGDDLENDWVAIFGFDVEVWLGSLAIVGDARYELGLSDISKASDITRDASSNTWILRAGLGWRH